MKRRDRIFIGFTIPILVISGLFTYLALENMNVKGNDEWSNNATLIAEIGVGIIITLFVLLITKLNEIKIEEKVSSVFNIVTEQENIRKEKEHSVQSRLYNIFENMIYDLSQILANVDAYHEETDSSLMKKYKDQIISDCNHIRLLSEKSLDDSTLVSTEFFDLNTIGTLKTISIVCKNKPIFDDNENKVNASYCTTLRDMIQPWIDDLAKKLDVKPITPTSPSDDSVSISASVDRTVYPLDSIIHARANLGDVIKGKLITFEIFNSKRKLLMSQTLDPATYDDPNLVGSNIFQTNFRMKGKEWKIGNEYILRATHDSSHAEDSFVIDQRTPVLQSDKFVYITGSDMIITVIDPDADKDNEVVEYVGDREDSKLIIESPYGNIDGYRLSETGDSTGIFQGIIGILGIRKNGTVISQEFDGKLIDKIQGIGIDDGFIGGVRGDELTAKYTNKSGTAKLTFFISNFGATVELDQKVYQPSDKVYITVVAPDFNFDSDKIDEIGIKPESAISIHTSKDRIDNYRLVETNSDSGIFTGEIQLEPTSSNSKSKGNGPTDGKLLCGDDDFIEISFRMFDDEEFIGKAKIKKNFVSVK
jgi:hypothetical protein